MKFHYAPGATPINLDEAAGLIPTGITLQSELDALEQAAILAARRWAFQRRHKEILSPRFALQLHAKMFAGVWRWAGTYRRSNKNIGADWTQVPIRTMQLFGDVAYWITNETYPWDELAVRFHHHLVSIHPFPNGNGRHARLITDLLRHQHRQEPFTWGESPLEKVSANRKTYIDALRAADAGDFVALIAFARSATS